MEEQVVLTGAGRIFRKHDAMLEEVDIFVLRTCVPFLAGKAERTWSTPRAFRFRRASR